MEIPFYRFWPQGTPLGKFSVGSTVQLLFDGVKTDFLVAHHGPTTDDTSSIYTGATWLLKKRIIEQVTYDTLFPGDAVSYVQTYLPRFSAKIQNELLVVPARSYLNMINKINQTKIFILNSDLARGITEQGHHLSIFDTQDWGYQMADGEGGNWWCASSYTNSKEQLSCYYHYWQLGTTNCGISELTPASDTAFGVLPAMCLPDKILVDKNGFIG